VLFQMTNPYSNSVNIVFDRVIVTHGIGRKMYACFSRRVPPMEFCIVEQESTKFLTSEVASRSKQKFRVVVGSALYRYLGWDRRKNNLIHIYRRKNVPIYFSIHWKAFRKGCDLSHTLHPVLGGVWK
jgi:hypothetical protein